MIMFGFIYLYILVGPSMLVGIAVIIIFSILNIFVVKKRFKY